MGIVATGPTPDFRRAMIFIDGENLVFNFQALLKKHTDKTNAKVTYKKDIYVWHPDFQFHPKHEILRANYYTFAVGSDENIQTISDEIKKLKFTKDMRSSLPENLRPNVFKKHKQDQRAKGVDIQLTVDILSNVYNNNLDTVILMTGDGDFLPIINEVIRHGKQVWLASFSSGLNTKLLNHVDKHIYLDNIYFDL